MISYENVISYATVFCVDLTVSTAGLRNLVCSCIPHKEAQTRIDDSQESVAICR